MSTSLTPEQQQAAYAHTSVVVTAGAGTGKTHMLAERYLYYLQERNLSPLEIVAVTFTEKAATELRARIRSLITQRLPDRLETLAELEAAQISTIHALASCICQEHYQSAGVPANFTVLDDIKDQIWLADHLQAALAQLPRQFYETIPYSLMSEAISFLLKDPYTAQKALDRGIQDWSKLIIKARQQGLIELVNDPIWHEAWSILHQYQGKEGDKLETLRQQVVAAMTDLEQEENIAEALATLDKIKVNMGSKKNWQDEVLPIVKETLTSLRELVRKIVKKGLINLELGAADDRLQQTLPALTKAYQEVFAYLAKQKQQERVLSFTDLEIYALQALNNRDVRNYYHQRWQVFLVDEFQDTNPTQAQLLTNLTKNAHLTIVGDVKQSIYGFRRADIRVFEYFRQQILNHKGKEVILSQSFRTHQTLVKQINHIFAGLLGRYHQDLSATREFEVGSIGKMEEMRKIGKEDNSFPYIQVFAVETDRESNKTERQHLEASYLAQRLKQMLEANTPIYDKQTQQLRPLQPKDIAILTRTWQPLETYYSEALAAAGIPVAPAGGGNLLATREAKDGYALLRFLADRRDNIALIAVLRSPFFAISDRLLFTLGIQEQTKQIDWWTKIKTSQISGLEHPITVLQQLLDKTKEEASSRILQLVDRLTGYTAVIANLPKAKRRLADWQGFGHLVKELEQGTEDIFGVVRRLKRLVDEEIAIPRPLLEIDNAVSLMTIFAAKGLEWSLVVVADLSRERPKSSPPVHFDSKLGVALNTKDERGEIQKPVLYQWLEYQQQQREAEEALRILYVALTRARDYLILSATESDKGDLARLTPGLLSAQIPIQLIPQSPPSSPAPLLPYSPAPPAPSLLLSPVGSGISELPVTALSEYVRCPQRFQFRFIQGHPGLGEGIAYSMQVGTLVHKALEYDLFDVSSLSPFAGSSWSPEVIQEAINLAHRFYQVPLYQPFRQTATAKEKQVRLQLGQITFIGVVDLVGDNWVLDYKSDRSFSPHHHRFQLWAYARALGAIQAHIAYLRHDSLYSFSETELNSLTSEVKDLVKQISAGNYQAKPSDVNCSTCPYFSLCEFAYSL
ncbi:MAG: UvrD-helicase domain-containing protein [Xenococcaceae cyanobacterium MO_188.B32]|nr:UvrD-helicase domain-containing protein [Xenococcaceae cyanobacterium MO_188.B32]